jgi:CDP-diacylglycerol--serine O-phosphatidyltransferase
MRAQASAGRRAPPSSVKRVILLPTLVTLANAFCGVLALSKAVDALAYSNTDPILFYRKMEVACSLVFLGMLFDTLDGWVARITRGFSSFGAQLDSFADALTFGLVPAMLAKVLVEHEAEVCGYTANPRIGFLAAAAFTLMAILRLVRFNLEEEGKDKQKEKGVFRGLPSPGAAGSVASTIWLYLILRRPELETSEGTPTPVSHVIGVLQGALAPALDRIPPALILMLPALGLLMVSNVRYIHGTSFLMRARSNFFTLVWLVFAVFLLFLAPVLVLFVFFNGFAVLGVVAPFFLRARGRASRAEGPGGS